MCSFSQTRRSRSAPRLAHGRRARTRRCGRAQQESPGGRALRADGTTVRFQHVRAHAGHGMNERADRLAARGAQGMRSRGGMIYVPGGDGRGHTRGHGVYAPPSGPEGGGQRREGKGGRRVVEVVGGGVWAQTQIDHSDRPCPWRPQPSRAHLFFVFVVHTMSTMAARGYAVPPGVDIRCHAC